MSKHAFSSFSGEKLRRGCCWHWPRGSRHLGRDLCNILAFSLRLAHGYKMAAAPPTSAHIPSKKKKKCQRQTAEKINANSIHSLKELHTLSIWLKSRALDQRANICLNGCISQGSWLQTLETPLAL